METRTLHKLEKEALLLSSMLRSLMGGAWDNLTTFQAMNSLSDCILSKSYHGGCHWRMQVPNTLPTHTAASSSAVHLSFSRTQQGFASTTRSIYSRSPKQWTFKETSDVLWIVCHHALYKWLFSVIGLWAGVGGKLSWKYRTQNIENMELRGVWKGNVTTGEMYIACEANRRWTLPYLSWSLGAMSLPHLHGFTVSLLEGVVVHYTVWTLGPQEGRHPSLCLFRPVCP